MFYIIDNSTKTLALYDDNVLRIKDTLEFMPQLQSERLLETDIITAEELRAHPNKVIIDENLELALNPNYEQEEAIKERQRLDALTLTPADVERALYKEKQMDFDDLKALIASQLPQVDIKGLAIEFRAKDFYRGAVANGMRLFDVVGALLGYTPADMDYLFEHKELPEG